MRLGAPFLCTTPSQHKNSCSEYIGWLLRKVEPDTISTWRQSYRKRFLRASGRNSSKSATGHPIDLEALAQLLSLLLKMGRPPTDFEHNDRFRDNPSQKRSIRTNARSRRLNPNLHIYYDLARVEAWRSACHLPYRYEHRTRHIYFRIQTPPCASATTLISRARRGDREAFTEMVSPCVPSLLQRARRVTGNVADAEDVRQETLLKAWSRLDQFSGNCDDNTDDFRAWLARIAGNTSIDTLRQRRDGKHSRSRSRAATPKNRSRHCSRQNPLIPKNCAPAAKWAACSPTRSFSSQRTCARPACSATSCTTPRRKSPSASRFPSSPCAFVCSRAPPPPRKNGAVASAKSTRRENRRATPHRAAARRPPQPQFPARPERRSRLRLRRLVHGRRRIRPTCPKAWLTPALAGVTKRQLPSGGKSLTTLRRVTRVRQRACLAGQAASRRGFSSTTPPPREAKTPFLPPFYSPILRMNGLARSPTP